MMVILERKPKVFFFCRIDTYSVKNVHGSTRIWQYRQSCHEGTKFTEVFELLELHLALLVYKGNLLCCSECQIASLYVKILIHTKSGPFLPTTAPPLKPVISVATGEDNIDIHWPVPGNGGRPITRYIVQIKEREDSEWTDCKNLEQEGKRVSCSFRDLRSGTEYVVRVMAVNIVGESEPAVVETKTLAGMSCIL